MFHIRTLFSFLEIPDTDNQNHIYNLFQLLERTLNECGDDIETAIKSLTELRLVSVEHAASNVGKESEYQIQANGVSFCSFYLISFRYL